MVKPNRSEPPRDLGYSKADASYYQDWIKQSYNLFEGKQQKDVLIFATALGKYHKTRSKLQSKQANIPRRSLEDKQKWAILPIGVSEANDLLCLMDEASIYQLAEEYANAGIQILDSNLKYYKHNYPKELEKQLKNLLKEEE